MKFIYCLMIIGFATSINAQVTFGVRAGLNLANVTISEEGSTIDITPDSRPGITVAGIVNIGITEAFSVQPEVHYIQKGYKLDIDFGFGSSKVNFGLNYLDIPIHAKYQFGGGENIGGYVLAGPVLGYALGGKVESCLDGDCETETLKFDDDAEGFNRTEFGLSLGGGVNIGKIFVDLRYVLGLSDLSEDPDQDGSTKNKGFQIGVGYMF